MRAAPFLLLTGVALAQDWPTDPASAMVEAIRADVVRRSEPRAVTPTRERLAYLTGVVDPRIPFESPTRHGTTNRASWPVLDRVSADGLWLKPPGKPVARVVVLPDAGEAPEESKLARSLVRAGCEVLVPYVLDRADKWSGNPAFRMTSQPHREFLWRMAYIVGRTPVGYEVQKTLAAIDWFVKQSKQPIGVAGTGEGGWIAMIAAALDPRIDAALVSRYLSPADEPGRAPLDRTVWGYASDLGGDEGVMRLAAGRVFVDPSAPAEWTGPSTADPSRRGGAPGRIRAIATTHADTSEGFYRKLGIRRLPAAEARAVRVERTQQQLTELIDHVQRLVVASQTARDSYWRSTPIESIRQRLRDDVIGQLPTSPGPLNARMRLTYRSAKWDGWEVMIDAAPGVFAYGVLLKPRNLGAAERRPVVVVQHGLNGRPQSMFQQRPGTRDFEVYRNLGETLADLGYVVYLPQNPYIGNFRDLNRVGHAGRLSMFSYIAAQHGKSIDWLETLPIVDAKRIGFYGLSYGGKTALHVPALEPRYMLSICSGNFNEWIRKLTVLDAPYTYMLTQEYEIAEFNIAHVAGHAEEALLIAPRPFMVERGHRDGVGDDEWVAYEYARVKRWYDEAGIGDRAAIEYFHGPHRIEARGTIDFLRRWLTPSWPLP
jgi:dienelactone hydrolase